MLKSNSLLDRLMLTVTSGVRFYATYPGVLEAQRYLNPCDIVPLHDSQCGTVHLAG